MELDGTSGEEDPLVDLESLLDGDGFRTDSSVVHEHPSGGWWMHASKDLTADKAVWGWKQVCHSIRPGSIHCP